MASSYSDGIAIELIGSGDQAGTWGDTTNENLKRLEQGVAEFATVTLTGTSTSWTLDEDVAAYAAGSQGRAAYVKFTDGGDLGGDATVQIRGDSGSDYPYRVFFTVNSLSASRNLIFQGGSAGSDVTVPNGCTALIYTTGIEASDDAVNGLNNLSLSNIMLGNDGYANFNTTTGASGYGLRDASGIIETKNESGDWLNVITGSRTAAESGEFHIFVFPVLSASTQSATSAHNLVTTPNLVTCSLRCITTDLGYAAGDEVYWSWSGAHTTNDGLSVYANATNVGYVLGSGDSIEIPRLSSTVGSVEAITLGSWSVVIRAWR